MCHWLQLTPLFLRSLGRLPLAHLFNMVAKLRNENPHRHNGQLRINTFFPPYPSPAFDRFLASAIKRARVPYSCYFAVTDQCPYSCPHCSYGKHTPGRLDTENAVKVIDQIGSIGTITLGFTGGEPLLRDDIATLVKAAGDCATIIFTTGYNLTDLLARKLADANLGCLMIGLESDNRREHDSTRGVCGSFDAGLAAINTSLQAGLYTAISTVATAAKIENGIIERMTLMAADLGVHEFRILEPIPTGSISGHPEQILNQSHSQRLYDLHVNWNRQNAGPAISGFSYLESDELFGCGAGYHHLYIDALGSVCPCDLTPLSFGNVLETPLDLIWQQMDRYFHHPRCGCLMKEICSDIARHLDCPLPLPPEISTQICDKIKPSHQLPGIFKKLLKP